MRRCVLGDTFSPIDIMGGRECDISCFWKIGDVNELSPGSLVDSVEEVEKRGDLPETSMFFSGGSSTGEHGTADLLGEVE